VLLLAKMATGILAGGRGPNYEGSPSSSSTPREGPGEEASPAVLWGGIGPPRKEAGKGSVEEQGDRPGTATREAPLLMGIYIALRSSAMLKLVRADNPAMPTATCSTTPSGSAVGPRSNESGRLQEGVGQPSPASRGPDGYSEGRSESAGSSKAKHCGKARRAAC